MPEPLPETTGPAVPPDHACAACGYLMGPAGGPRCPECGRVATDEDVTQATRRGVYLEATLRSTAATHLALPMIAVAMMGLAMFTAAYALYASLHVGIMAAILGRVPSQATADRVLHMATLRSAWVLHAPLLVGVAALEYMEHRRWAFMFASPRQGNLALPDLIGIGAPLLVLLGVALHRLAARRAYRIAGVTEWAGERTSPAVRRGWVYPPLAIASLIAIGYVLVIATN
ncbi:MAG: hypothetical protein ACIAS6_03225 [Phycisphaerales bacterium JB060]